MNTQRKIQASLVFLFSVLYVNRLRVLATPRLQRALCCEPLKLTVAPVLLLQDF